MTQFMRAMAWLLIALGTVLSCLLLASFIYAFFVPDPSGSPDARGMALGFSLAALVFVALPILALGLVALWFAKRSQRNHGQSI